MRPVFLALCVASMVGTASAQDPARERLTREAAGQAAEADKLFKQGRFEEALNLYRAERKSRRELGDVRYEAYACRGIACCLARLGDWEEAVEAARDAKKIDLSGEDKGLAGYDALLVARGLIRLGDDDAAEKELAFAVGRFTGGEDRDHEAEARVLLGGLRLHAGKRADSAKEFDRALAIAETLDAPALLAEVWAGVSALDRAEGRLGLAYERLSDAQRIYAEELNDEETALRLDSAIGDLLADLGNLEAAESRFATAADAYARRDDPASEGAARLAAAGIRLDLRDPKGAVSAADRAIECFRRVGAKGDEIDALVVRAQARELAGDKLGGFESFREATLLGERIYRDVPEEVVRLALLAAEAARRLDKKTEVDRFLGTAETSAIRSGRADLKEQVRASAKRLAPR